MASSGRGAKISAEDPRHHPRKNTTGPSAHELPEEPRIKPKDRQRSARDIHPSPPQLSTIKSPPRPRSDPNIKAKRTWPPSPAVEECVEENEPSEIQSRGTLDQDPILIEANIFSSECIETQHEPVDLENGFQSVAGIASVGVRQARKAQRKPKPAPINSKSPESSNSDQMEPFMHTSTSKIATSLKTGPMSSRSPAFPYDERFGRPTAQTGIERTSIHAEQEPYDAIRNNDRAGQKDTSSRSRTELYGKADWDYETSSSLSGSFGPRSNLSAISLGEDDHYKIHNDTRNSDRGATIGELKAAASRIASESSDPRFSQSVFHDVQREGLPIKRAYYTPVTASPIGMSPPGPASGDSVKWAAPRNGSQSQTSPPSSFPIVPLSPPRSPNRRASHAYDDQPRDGRSTTPKSKPTSRQASPGSNSTRPRYVDNSRRTSTLPLLPGERSPGASGGTSLPSVPRNIFVPPPVLVRSAAFATGAASSLPYPTSIPMMPSPDDHRSKPRSSGVSPNTQTTFQAAGGPSKNDQTPYTQQVQHRPRPESRHTYTGQYPGMMPANVSPLSPTVPSLSRSFSTPSSPMDVVHQSLVPCSRPRPVSGYTDWHVLNGYPDFNICPTCLASVTRNQFLKQYFNPGLPKNPKMAYSCAFGTPWMRLAWQITLNQGRNDLGLIYSLARIDSEDSCPRSKKDKQYWYTIVDKKGRAVLDLHVCLCDVRKIEALLPGLRSHFVRSDEIRTEQKCDLRSDSNRFQEYLRLLVTSHSKAVFRNEPANLKHFIHHAEHKADFPECARHQRLLGARWHFPASMPEFTVCEDCYDSVIFHAAVREGSAVALLFNYQPAQHPDEAARNKRRGSSKTNSSGPSCQLYSSRMRSIFDRAVDSGDHRPLWHEARQRTEWEAELMQRKHKLELRIEEANRTLEKQRFRGDWRDYREYNGLKAVREQWYEEWTRWDSS